jgi:hypothetical protein
MKYVCFFISMCFLLTACERDQSVVYKATALHLSHVVANNAGTTAFFGDSCRALNYGVRLALDPAEVSRTGKIFDTYESGVRMSPSIQNIFISANGDFDNAHPRGSFLNELFYYFPNNYAFAQALKDTMGFNPTAKYMSDYEQQNFPKYADLLLTRPISSSASMKFYVKMLMSDGTVFEDSTNTIRLLP